MQVAVLSKNLRSMKENAVIAALPPMIVTKYSYNNNSGTAAPHRHMSTGAAICAF